ncbi:ubiquinone biosynthesis hydrox, partial [Rhodotorula sp. JG-1b]
EQHDVVVVGGGPAGLALTAALSQSDALTQTHSITLVEGGSLDQTRGWSPRENEYSNRVSSITAENKHWLIQTGIWKHLDEARTRPLSELQVWDGLSNARIEFHGGDDWDAAFAAAMRPRRANMSTMVENLNLQRAALRRIDECARDRPGNKRIELLDGNRVEAIERVEGGWPVLNLRNSKSGRTRRIRARLLIGADGANSPVKAYSNIESFGWAYDRHGVVATLAVDPLVPGQGMNTGWQRFLPEGPIAFLPVSDTHASLVWSTTPAYAALIKSLPLEVLAPLVDAAFTLPHDQLTSFLDSLIPPPEPLSGSPPAAAPLDAPALVNRLQGLLVAHSQATYDPSNPAAPLPPSVVSVQPSSVASFPLRLSHTSSYLGLPTPPPPPPPPAPSPSTDVMAPVAAADIAQDMRTVLVGDAAHTVHPLAGQGLNLGLADSRSLSTLLTRLALQGADLGAYLSLKPYPKERYLANHAVLSACDHLASLYARTDPVSVWARSTGVEVLNELGPVKDLIMRRAGSAAAADR